MIRKTFLFLILIVIIANSFCFGNSGELSVEDAKKFCYFLKFQYENITDILDDMKILASVADDFYNKRIDEIYINFNSELYDLYDELIKILKTSQFKEGFPLDCSNENWIPFYPIDSNNLYFRYSVIFTPDFSNYLENLYFEDILYNINELNIVELIYLIDLLLYKTQSIRVYLETMIENIK